MFKNTASQKWRVFAFNTSTGAAVTGDAANITAKIRQDWGALGAVTDTNPTEVEDGYYDFDITAAECNGDVLDLFPESSTSNVQVVGTPGTIFPRTQAESTVVQGTVDTASFTPTTTQFEADDITEATADHYNGRVVIWTSGALQNQATDITDYELAGSNGRFTVTTMTEAPGNNDTFVIV